MDAARHRVPGCTGAEAPLPPSLRPAPGRYARFVGRVGALAVALGVGVAVATTYGMPAAHADDTAQAADRSDDDSSDTGRAAGGTTGGGLPGKATDTEDDDDLGDDEDKDDRDDELSAGIGRNSADDEPEDVFGSEAGHTAADSDLDAEAAETETGGDTEYDTADDVSTEPITTAPLTPDDSAAPVPGTGPDPGANTNGNTPAPQDDPTPRTDGPLIGGSGAAFGPAAIETHSAVGRAGSDDANHSADNPLNTFMTMNATEGQQVSPLFATRPKVIEAERPNLIAGLLVLPGIALRLVATVAVALLSPFLAIGPSAPAQPLSLWALLGWVRREFERTLFNKTPHAVDDTSVSTAEDTPVTFSPVANDTDPDADRVTVTDYTQPAHGTVTYDAATKQFTYTPDADFHGTDTFTYSVSDQAGFPHWHGFLGGLLDTGHRDTATVTITVTPVNDGAPIPQDGTATVTEGGTTTIDVLVGATDPDGDNTIDPTTVTIVTGPAHGTTTINPTTGAITYTHDGSETLTDTITYTVDDTTGATSEPTTVSITVTPVDDAPAIVSVTASAPNPNTGAVTYTIVVTDSDTPAAQLTIGLTAPTNGTLSQPISTVPGTYTVTYTPNPQARLDAYVTSGADVDSFQITISDHTTPVTVTVSDVPIDPAETAVIAVITTGARPQAVAISPDGTRAYVPNWNGDTVTVIDTAASTVVATVTVGFGPYAVAFSPDGTRAYVGNYGSSTVSVIDTATLAVVGSIAVPSGPTRVAFSPDGTRAYISTGGAYGGLSIVDTATLAVVSSYMTAGNPTSVAVSPDGTRVYMTNGYGYVTIFNTATNWPITSIMVPSGSGNVPAWSVAFSPDGTRAYVAASSGVMVIDTATNTIIDTDPDQPGSQNIVVSGGPDDVVFSPDGTRAYVSTRGRSISIIDTATYSVLDTVGIGTSATAVAISPDGSKLYVTDGDGNTVTVLGFAANL